MNAPTHAPAAGPVGAALVVPREAFIILWWSTQLFHIVCAVNAYAVIEIHRYFFNHDEGGTIEYLGSSTFSFFKPVIAINGVFVVCHMAAFFLTVRWSVKHREWRFVDKPSPRNEELRTVPTNTPDVGIVVSRPSLRFAWPRCLVAIVMKVMQDLSQLALFIYSIVGKFGVQGPHYEVGFVVCEVIEIALQVYQAYKLSGLVPSVWINRLYATVLVLNCWSTPWVHLYVRHNHLAKRIMLRVVDALFKVITSMVIPVAIFYPYYVEFDLVREDFPLVDYYSDVWFVQANSENRQVFVTSWLDFASKMMPGVSILGSVLIVKQYVVMEQAVAQKTLIKEAPAVVCESIFTSNSRVVPLESTPSKAALNELLKGRSSRHIPRAPETEASDTTKLLIKRPKMARHDLLFVLCGIVILVIHIHATLIGVNSRFEGCLVEVRPWFQTAPSCIVLELNCLHGQFNSGSNASAIERTVRTVNLGGIKSIVVASCSQLVVPPVLQEMPALQMIKVYNSTIERWDVDAELRDDLHQDLQMLYVCDTNFTGGEIPVGLLGDAFPTRLVDVEFSITNLERLPYDLNEKWAFLQYFVLEGSPRITEFPETLLKLEIPQVALGSNNISAIPDDMFVDQAFLVLRLDGNPLTALPKEFGSLEQLYKIGISFTLVSDLPPWMSAVAPETQQGEIPPDIVHVLAGGSPLCQDAQRRASAKTFIDWNCLTNVSPLSYPVDQERRWRAASPAVMRFGPQAGTQPIRIS